MFEFLRRKAPEQKASATAPMVAYAASLARLKAEGRSVKMLWQHDPARPIGVWDEVREDARGLFVKGRLLSDVAQAREAMALVEAGAIDGLSIGYRTKQATKDGAGRRLVEVDLWEVSLVTFPMLPEARVGVLESALAEGPLGVLDRGAAVQVCMLSGTLSSITDDALLAGGNVALIGDGTPDGWEVVQFQTAELVGVNTYQVSDRLRGQRGSESRAWPAGSWFVLFDGVPSQINLASDQRGIERHFRIGPARQAVSDASYVHEVQSFAGNGLRPFAPVHLKAARTGGDVDLTWIRQTRIDGDRWDLSDVPLNEESESYEVRVLLDGQLLRQEVVNTPSWIYSAADQASDSASGLVQFEVAQISARFGAGRSARVSVGL